MENIKKSANIEEKNKQINDLVEIDTKLDIYGKIINQMQSGKK